MKPDVTRDAGWLAETLADQERRLSAVESRKAGLANSSIEDGAIDDYTLDGTLGGSTGKQFDGSHGSVSYSGPAPAVPVAPSLKARPGFVEVRWSGKFTGDAVSAMDFKHVAVHVSTTPTIDTTPSTQVATIRGELGDIATLAADAGMLYVCLVAWSAAGKSSTPSPVSEVLVPFPADGRSPAAPTGLSVTADIQNNDQGVPVGMIHAGWSHSGKATDGTDLTVRQFNLFYRQTGSNKFQQLASSPGTSLDFAPLPIGAGVQYDIYAVAVGMNGIASLDSSMVTVTMAKDTTPPAKPSTPIVLADHTVFAVAWDGKTSTGAAMPVDFDYCAVQWWNGTTWLQLHTVGKSSRATIPGLAVGANKFRLVAYDISGNASTPSNEVTGTSVELVNDQSIADAVAALNTSIAAVQTSANGKNKIINSTSNASGTTGYVSGDRWQKWTTLSTGGKLLATWRFTTSWIAEALDPTYIPLLDIGSGTFGNLNGGRIEANSMLAQSLVLGDFTNLADGGSFDNADDLAKWDLTTPETTIDTASEYSGVGCLKVTAAATTRNLTLKRWPSVVAGEKYYYEFYVKMTSDWNGTPGNSKLRIGDQSATIKFSLVFEPLSTTWVKRSGSFTIPSGMTSMRITLPADHTVGTLWIDALSIRRMGEGNLIVDGEIMARHIDVNSLTADSGFIGQARTNILSVGSVPNSAMQVGIDNLFINPGWEDAGRRSQYPAPTGWEYYYTPTTNAWVYSGNWTVRTSDPNVNVSWPFGDHIPCVPGDKFYLSAWIIRNSAGVSSRPEYALYWYRSDRSFGGVAGTIQPATSVPSGHHKYDAVITVPAEAAFVRPVLDSDGSAGMWAFDNLELRRVLGGTNDAGQAAELSPQGMRLFNEEGIEVVSLTSTPPNSLSIKDAATGADLASIGSDGAIAAQAVSAENALFYQGAEMTDILDAMPKGLVAWASRATNGLYWAGSAAQPYLHLRFAAKAGRSYMVSTSPIGIDSEGTTADPVVYLHYETANANASTSSQVIAKGIAAQGTSASRRNPITFNRLITPPDGDVSLLISYGVVSNSRAKISISSGQASVVLSVEDMGPAVPMTGEYRDGSGDSGSVDPTPPPAVKNYDTTWNATGLRSFVGSGATYAYNTGYMYSGLSPSGYGDLSSMAVFPSLTSTLSGATISDIWISVYYDFWYQGSGGIAAVSLHGQSALTSTKPSMSFAQTSSGWPRASSRWVRLNPALYAGFKSGAWRGFGLGGHGGGYAEYGYAHNPKIRIKYTK